MECKICREDNESAKKTCGACGAILAGETRNNVTGKMGIRNSDGSFTPYRSNGTMPELLEQNADLLSALRLCLPIIEAHTEASHLTDGFKPRVNKNDHILAKVKAAIEKGEGK